MRGLFLAKAKERRKIRGKGLFVNDVPGTRSATIPDRGSPSRPRSVSTSELVSFLPPHSRLETF